jgi:alpha-aminoadipate carrier protein LysW
VGSSRRIDMAQCPECEAMVDLEVDDVEEGQLVSCPDCGVDLEVVNTNPIELDLASDEDDDDEDESDDDDTLEDDDDDEDLDDDDMDFDEDGDQDDENTDEDYS